MESIKRLIYLGGIYSIGSVFEKALGFFLIPVYTAYLGTTDYGIVGLMSVTIGLVSKLIVPPIVSGFIRHYDSPEYRDTKSVLLFNSFLFLTIQSIGLALFFYLFKNIISELVLENKELIYIVEIYAIILFFQPLSQFLTTFVQQEEKAKFYIFISWVRFLGSAGVILVGLIYFEMGVLALIYGNLAGEVLTVVFILPLFWKYSTPKISFSILKPPLGYGYPRIMSGFSLLLIQSGDRYVLKFFSSLATVGLYSFGYTFSGIINFLLIMPLKQALHPMTYKQEHNPQQQRDFLRQTCTYYYFVGMLLCLFLSLYSKEMIEFMASRQEFWGSWVIVPIITFSYLQHGLGNYFDWGLMMTKKSFTISINVVIAAVLNIVFNFIFIPFWGVLGAAFATLLSYVAWNGLKLYYSAKYYDLYFELGRLGHITIAGIAFFLLSLLLANTGSFIFDVVVKFVILLCYPLIFFFTGFFTSKEKEYMRKLQRSVRTNGLRETYTKLRAI